MAEKEKLYAIELPLIPRDFAYEDYVSSVLNAGGYYLERGIHKREAKDILELDIVTNKFTADGTEKTILEIKSGGWGFPEIFKVRGWMDYLGFSKAAFVVQTPDPNQSTYNDVAGKLGINMIVTENNNGKLDYEQIQNVYSISHSDNEKAFVENLRFSYALERKIIEDIYATAKSNKNLEGFQVLKKYLFDLCDNTFFESMPSKRINKTFELFTEHRHITARLDNEREDNLYSQISNEDIKITDRSFQKLFYDHKEHNKLYGALYVEMLNRLHVLKHCVDDLLKPSEEQPVEKFIENINHEILPSNIKDALTEFKKHTYFYLYPYFWQIFIFLFGGFILEDKKDDEYKLLSEITGVPETDIDNALSVFDILFPITGGWMQKVHKTSIRLLKFMPSPFCGIGVNLRKDVYSKNKTLDEMKEIFTQGYTYNDLIRYNNLAYEYLKKSNDVKLVEKPLQD